MNYPNIPPRMMESLRRLMDNAPLEASMPKPVLGRKDNPLPQMAAPGARAPKTDRLLTEREKMLYKQFKGNYPPEGMTLAEFRRYMGQVRKRGGFKA